MVLGIAATRAKRQRDEGSNMTWNKCDVCGRFITLKAFVEGKAERRLIYPASEFTCEMWETLCADHAPARQPN
jgi:hypothetical protein